MAPVLRHRADRGTGLKDDRFQPAFLEVRRRREADRPAAGDGDRQAQLSLVDLEDQAEISNVKMLEWAISHEYPGLEKLFSHENSHVTVIVFGLVYGIN